MTNPELLITRFYQNLTLNLSLKKKKLQKVFGTFIALDIFFFLLYNRTNITMHKFKIHFRAF